MDQGLRQKIARGKYVVDPHAVAAAIVARSRVSLTRSGVLVASEGLHGTPFRVDETKAGPEPDPA